MGCDEFLGRRTNGLQPLRGARVVFLVLALCVTPLPVHSQATPVRLDTLHVQVGSRANTRLPSLTRAVQLLDSRQIEALPVRTLSGLLEWATAVEIQTRSPAQSDLGIRGSSFEQVVVLVNGVRMSDPQTGHFDLDLTIPLDHVERLEVLRGPASALYGADAMGGVVNVVTKDTESAWDGRVEGGSWGTARVSGGAGGRGLFGAGYRIGGEFSRSDGHRGGTDHESMLLHLGIRRRLDAGALSGDLGIARRDFGAQEFYAPYPSFEKTRAYTSSVRWASTDAPRSGLEVGFAFRRHEDEFTLIRTDPSVYQNRHTSSQAGGDALVRGNPHEGVSLVAGGELFRDFLRSNALGDRGETRGALFLEAVVGTGSPGMVSAGLRRDWHQSFGDVVSPSFSGSLRLGSKAKLRTALGRSFRAPTWTERYYSDPVNRGRPDLDPESAWSGEMGFDVAPMGSVVLGFTGFVRKAENLIDWARATAGTQVGQDPPPWETRNVEEATFRGYEIDASGLAPLGLEWRLGGMWLSVDADEASGFISKYALRPLEEQVTLGLLKVISSGATLGLNMHRARRGGEDPYLRVNLRGRFQISGLRFYVDATNLLGEEYPDITGALAPGRGVYVGIEIGSETVSGG